MAVRRLYHDQPATFAFTPENESWAYVTIAKYPEGKQSSAVIPLLWRAQEQHKGWLPEPAIRYVADMLDMAYIRVYEIATFYTMFQLRPVGEVAHIQVCGTTPCMLRGSEELVAVCKRRIASQPHLLSEDGKFSWEEVECLGVCANAPMVQIWKDTYEDLTPDLFEKVIDGFAADNPPIPGSQIGRIASSPQGGMTTLTDQSIYESRSTPTTDLTEVVSEAPSASPSSFSSSSSLLSSSLAATTSEPTSAAPVATASSLEDAKRPPSLIGPRDGKPDDLKMIKGVGPKLEKTLNELGIYHYDQIAAWSVEAVAWIDDYLSFTGRIDRDGWIEQAQVLARGGDTEFSKRADYRGATDDEN
ncbi:MAG: NADH-quinone oxidoreductase subunit NuoE [Hyphomicrobiaceae bacterium]